MESGGERQYVSCGGGWGFLVLMLVWAVGYAVLNTLF